MKNKYHSNLSKIEFVVTYACTGHCKHCAEGDHTATGERIDSRVAADTVKKICAEYDIKTVMAFGGEPLIYTDATYSIMSAAKELDIPCRQIITNGYFSKNEAKISEVADRLFECGVNDLLLSVDAFHQETIPLDTVKLFAKKVKERGIPARLSPAWLVSPDHDNPYNRKTREIIEAFAEREIPEGEGNVVFPSGNAKKYLSEYFSGEVPKNPYEENPFDVRCVSVSPNGDTLGDNIYRCDILEIIKNYKP